MTWWQRVGRSHEGACRGACDRGQRTARDRAAALLLLEGLLEPRDLGLTFYAEDFLGIEDLPVRRLRATFRRA